MRQQTVSLPVLLVLLLVLGSGRLSEAQPLSGKFAPYTCFFNECAASKANQDSLKALGDCLKSGRQTQTHVCCLHQHGPDCLPHVAEHFGCLLSLCLQPCQLQPPRLSCLARLHSQRPKSESLLLVASERTLPMSQLLILVGANTAL